MIKSIYKLISLVLVFAFAFMMLPFAAYQTNAAPLPSPSVIDGYENVCLTYHFRPDSGSSVRQTAEDLLPYVAYLGTDGEILDFFFDSYLFLPWNTTGPSGATMHGGTNNPTVASDWIAYVNDVFWYNRNVDALNTAMGQTKSALNNDTEKAGVFFSILYPAHNQKNFGSLGGKELDLSKQEDREYAIKWIIDEQLNRFAKKGYEHLDVVGFYWLEEEIYSSYDKDMMLYASEYLHSLGLKFIWIPWFKAPGYDKWQSYGFDLACLQPNEIWNTNPLPNRTYNCATLCNTYGMSMQIETRHETKEQSYFDRYVKYLHSGITSGAMDSVKFYYQDGKPAVYHEACYSDNALFRSVYDLTYQYAKGTLTEEDLGFKETEQFELPQYVYWASYGKTYTGCRSYTDGNGMPYQQVSGKELTDGVLGSTLAGTEWHAFHKSILDEDGRMSTTIDLGEVYTGLTHVMAQFDIHHPYSIGAPRDVRIYISEDGENYTLLTIPMLKNCDTEAYIKYVAKTPFDARYVKMSFTNTKPHNFVFCSEFLVGIQKEHICAAEGDWHSNGTNHWKLCSCGEKIDLYSHTPGAEADCETDQICTVCEHVLTEAYGHTAKGNWKYDDETHWKLCSCGEKLDADSHDYEWVVTLEPQVGVPGEKAYTCKDCDYVSGTEEIPALEPDESEPDESEPDVSEPNVSEPDESEPDVSEPNVSEPDESEPDESEPDVFEPDESEPDVSEPDDSEPDVSETDESEPDVSEPDDSEPDEPTTAIGDIDGDSDIDAMDYLYLKRAYFSQYPLSDISVGDIDHDGIIGSMDYLYLKRVYFSQYVIK